MKKNTLSVVLSILAIAVVTAACGGDAKSDQMRELSSSCRENNLQKFKGQFSGEAHAQFANKEGFNKLCGIINETLLDLTSTGNETPSLTYIETELTRKSGEVSRTLYTIKEIPGVSLTQSCRQTCTRDEGKNICSYKVCDVVNVDLNADLISENHTL